MYLSLKTLFIRKIRKLFYPICRVYSCLYLNSLARWDPRISVLAFKDSRFGSNGTDLKSVTYFQAQLIFIVLNGTIMADHHITPSGHSRSFSSHHSTQSSTTPPHHPKPRRPQSAGPQVNSINVSSCSDTEETSEHVNYHYHSLNNIVYDDYNGYEG